VNPPDAHQSMGAQASAVPVRCLRDGLVAEWLAASEQHPRGRSPKIGRETFETGTLQTPVHPRQRVHRSALNHQDR